MRDTRLKTQDSRHKTQGMRHVACRLSRVACHALHPVLGTRAGQALVELAILGAMILLVLGVLVDYGLRADFTQHAMMRTFREVLHDASRQTAPGEPISTSRLSLADRRIPDPANPFALGGTAAISGSAGGVTQNYQLHKTPDTPADMPHFYALIGGAEVNCGGIGCLTSGIRRVGGFAMSLPRYQVVYGASNVCAGGKNCPAAVGELFIQDPCMGEIVDVDMCRRVGRLMTNDAACAYECGLEGRSDCGTVCDQRTYPTDRPWYTTATEEQWAALEPLGVQPGSTRRSVLKGPGTGDAFIQKLESDERIATTTALTSEETTTREFRSRAAGANTDTKTVTSTNAVDGAVTWETAW